MNLSIRNEGHHQQIRLQDKAWWQWSNRALSCRIDGNGQMYPYAKKYKIDFNKYFYRWYDLQQSEYFSDVRYIWSLFRALGCKNYIAS